MGENPPAVAPDRREVYCVAMSTQKPRVTIEVTERELAYLAHCIDYPYSSHQQLNTKLGDAKQAMRLAKRDYNRALKEEREARRQQRLAENEGR
jgi:hypothetical protein